MLSDFNKVLQNLANNCDLVSYRKMEKPALLRMLTGEGFVTSSENISTGGNHSVVRKSSEVVVLDVYLYPVNF